LTIDVFLLKIIESAGSVFLAIDGNGEQAIGKSRVGWQCQGGENSWPLT
jgi:hypothetical protein